MRDYSVELEKRAAFIRKVVSDSGAAGVVLGNSGGKDSALVAILCKAADVDMLAVQMPCQSSRNFGQDMDDALELARVFDFPCVTVNITPVKEAVLEVVKLPDGGSVSGMASANIAPRLRMTALYAIAQSMNHIVAGTGNRSEAYMGYFTKWGDGAYDFNPIADLTVTEIYEFLRYVDAPEAFLTKAPSAGLFEGQTDESEMGVTYAELDELLLKGVTPPNAAKIEQAHCATEHKRRMPVVYEG